MRNPAGISTAVPFTTQANACQLFTIDGKNVWGTHADGTLLGKAGVFPSTPSAPAAPGETISVYATGLGVTTPAQIPGQLPTTAASVAALPKVTIGGADATVVSATVVPGAAGQYQINVQVPPNTPNGDMPLVVMIGTGSSTPVNLTILK